MRLQGRRLLAGHTSRPAARVAGPRRPVALTASVAGELQAKLASTRDGDLAVLLLSLPLPLSVSQPRRRCRSPFLPASTLACDTGKIAAQINLEEIPAQYPRHRQQHEMADPPRPKEINDYTKVDICQLGEKFEKEIKEEEDEGEYEELKKQANKVIDDAEAAAPPQAEAVAAKGNIDPKIFRFWMERFNQVYARRSADGSTEPPLGTPSSYASRRWKPRRWRTANSPRPSRLCATPRRSSRRPTGRSWSRGTI